MSEKKNNSKTLPTAHRIVRNEIRIDIVVRQSHSGYLFYDYSCFRQYVCRSSGKTICSSSFFARNCDDLVKGVQEATQWINEHNAIVPSNEQIPLTETE
jgi:hypothetical protein